MVVKIKELKERMNTIKEFIIRTKLEMIFKLDVKEELLKKFKKFNERYKKIKKEILFYEKKKEKNQKNKERKEKVEIEKIKLEGYKKVYIESIDNYISTRTQSYLSDAIELYIKDILVLEEKIRNLSFAIITIDKKKDEFELIKQRNTISSEELYL